MEGLRMQVIRNKSIGQHLTVFTPSRVALKPKDNTYSTEQSVLWVNHF